jgi:hypothetical protein
MVLHDHLLLNCLLQFWFLEVENLACPTLRWIGVHCEDIERYRIPPCLLVELTKNDEKKIASMTQREVILRPEAIST